MKILCLLLIFNQWYLSSSASIIPIESSVDIKHSDKNYDYSYQERHRLATIDHPSLQTISQHTPIAKVNQPHQGVLIDRLVNKVQIQPASHEMKEPIFSLDEGQRMQNQNPQAGQQQPIGQMQQQKQEQIMQTNNILQPKQEIIYTPVPIAYNYVVPISYQYALSYPHEIYYPYNIIGTVLFK